MGKPARLRTHPTPGRDEMTTSWATAASESALGLIVPSVNRVVEQEWSWAWPKSVPYYVTRARYVLGENAMDRLCDDAMRAAEDLAGARPSFGVFACTVAGYGADETLDDSLSARMGCPVITASTSVLQALRAISARTVALVTPYAAPAVESGTRFLSDNGYSVGHSCGMGIVDGALESDVEPAEVLAYATAEVAPGSVDAVLISCTNLRSWEIVPELELRLSCPVITSNQAMLATALRGVGLASLPPDRFGRLFERLDHLR